jgi:hypothetical protein
MHGNRLVLQTATGQFCLFSYLLAVGEWAFTSGFPIPIKNCPEAFQLPGISQQHFYALLTLPNGCPTVFKSISQRYQVTWQFSIPIL